MKNFMKNILHKIFSINYPWLKKRLQDKIKAINHFSVETWLHGTNSRLNGNLPFLAHTKEFHTTVTGPLIRRYAITISKHRVVNVNSPKEDAWIIKKPRSGNYHIMGRSRGTSLGQIWSSRETIYKNSSIYKSSIVHAIYLYISSSTRDSSKLSRFRAAVIPVEYFRRK